MDSTVIAAVISAATALLVAGTPYVLKALQGSRRVSRFVGVWTGQGSQNTDERNAAKNYAARLEISSTNKITLRLHRKDDQFDFENNLDCKVLAIEGTLLLAQYKNVRPETVQFGSVLFKLSGDGRELLGNFVGYGIKSEVPLMGALKLTRT